jgi:L-threonylcarbamoyladenylate synthase
MLKEEVAKALKVLQEGGIILYPTDTIWGIGCDASNTEAVKKIYDLKQREESKSMIILLDNDNKLLSYVREVPDISSALISADGSVGIRVVKHQFCEQLIQRLRKPLVSTSANISGQPSPKYFDDISPDIIAGVDYVVNLEQHERQEKKPSTIMKLEPDGRFIFIRK